VTKKNRVVEWWEDTRGVGVGREMKKNKCSSENAGFKHFYCEKNDLWPEPGTYGGLIKSTVDPLVG